MCGHSWVAGGFHMLKNSNFLFQNFFLFKFVFFNFFISFIYGQRRALQQVYYMSGHIKICIVDILLGLFIAWTDIIVVKQKKNIKGIHGPRIARRDWQNKNRWFMNQESQRRDWQNKKRWFMDQDSQGRDWSNKNRGFMDQELRECDGSNKNRRFMDQ